MHHSALHALGDSPCQSCEAIHRWLLKRAVARRKPLNVMLEADELSELPLDEMLRWL